MPVSVTATYFAFRESLFASAPENVDTILTKWLSTAGLPAPKVPVKRRGVALAIGYTLVRERMKAKGEQETGRFTRNADAALILLAGEEGEALSRMTDTSRLMYNAEAQNPTWDELFTIHKEGSMATKKAGAVKSSAKKAVPAKKAASKAKGAKVSEKSMQDEAPEMPVAKKGGPVKVASGSASSDDDAPMGTPVEKKEAAPKEPNAPRAKKEPGKVGATGRVCELLCEKQHTDEEIVEIIQTEYPDRNEKQIRVYLSCQRGDINGGRKPQWQEKAKKAWRGKQISRLYRDAKGKLTIEKPSAEDA
jgi:hypothetical protein